MAECVNDKVYDKKEENETTDSESTTFDEGKGVNYENGGKGVAFVKEEEFNSRPSS